MKKILMVLVLVVCSAWWLGGDVSAYDPLPLGASEAYDEILRDNVINNAIGGQDTQSDLRTILSENFVSLLNFVIGSVAILFLVITGVKMIFSKGSADQSEKYKKEFLWVFVGLVVISAAEFIAFEIFDPVDPTREGGRDILTGGASFAALTTIASEIKRYFQYIVIGFIVIQGGITGYNLALASGSSDDDLENEKKFVTSAGFGILLILLSELVVSVFSLQGVNPADANTGAGVEASAVVIDQVVGIINYLLTLFGIVGVLLLVWAAVYYITSFGNEDQMNRAKRLILTAVVGLVVVASSFALMNFFFL